MTMRNMRSRRIGSTIFAVHTPTPPAQDEWDEFVECARKALEHGPARILVRTSGGGPNTRQRRQINGVCAGRKVRAAIMSDSKIVRGIVTTLSWMRAMDIQAFPPLDVAGAAAFLELSQPLPELEEILAKLTAGLGEAKVSERDDAMAT